MGLYGAFLDLQNVLCLVVGGGKVAERKIQSLLKAEGEVTVIAPELTPRLEESHNRKEFHLIRRVYRQGDLKRFALVIGATDSEETNRQIYFDALEEKIWVNTVGQPGNSNFIVPSHMKRGNLSVAISTSGKLPSLAKQTRLLLESLFDEEAEGHIEKLSKLRESILKEQKQEVKEHNLQEILDKEIAAFLKKLIEKRFGIKERE